MSTSAITPDYTDDDPFELPPLPQHYLDYNEFVAKWEEEGREESRRMLGLGAKMRAKMVNIYLESNH